MDFSNLDLTSFAGIAGSVWVLINVLKWRWGKWVSGKEQYLAVGLPVLTAVVMKVAGWGFVTGMNWWQMLTGALAAGLASQVMHDKLEPGVASAWDHLKSMATGK